MAKKKKFKQLTLPGMPRPRDLMTPEARYPRGYTPGRQKEMLDALHRNRIDITHDQGSEMDDREETGADPEWLHRDDVTPEIYKAQQGIAKDHVVRMLSNSSISPNQLEGLSSIHTFTGTIPGAPQYVDGGYHDPELCKFNTSRGTPCSMHGIGGDSRFLAIAHSVGLPGDHEIIKDQKYAAKAMREMNLITDKEKKEGNSTALNRLNITGNTLVHEFGHHVQRNITSPFRVGDPAHSGFMEADADNYAAEHIGKQFKDKKEYKPGDGYPERVFTNLLLHHSRHKLDSHRTEEQRAILDNHTQWTKGYLTYVKRHSGEKHKEILRQTEASFQDHLDLPSYEGTEYEGLLGVFKGTPKHFSQQLSFDDNDSLPISRKSSDIDISPKVRTRSSEAQQKELDSEEEIDPSINIRNR